MTQPISQVLHEFLHDTRILAEISRRMKKNLSTLASELNPNCSYAKFGLDDFLPLCLVLREMGYDRELDGILYAYFESLRSTAADVPANDELLPLVYTLMEKTGTLASQAMKLIDNADTNELRQTAALLRSTLLPTTLRLGSVIDARLSRIPESENVIPKLQTSHNASGSAS